MDQPIATSYARAWIWVLPLWFSLLAVLYADSFGFGPVIDDPLQLDYVRTFSSSVDTLSNDAIGYFRPVKNFLFYAFARDSMMPIRVVGFLLFCAYTVSIYFLLRRFFGPVVSLMATLAFSLHPAQVSVVAFPSAYNNIVCAIFCILFVLVADRLFSDEIDFRKALPLLALTAVLAMVSYELGVAVLPLLGLVVFYRHEPILSTRTLVTGLQTVALLLGYLVTRSATDSVTASLHYMLPRDVTRLDLILSAPYYTLRHLELGLIPLAKGGVRLTDDPATRGALVMMLTWLTVLALSALSLVAVVRYRNRFAYGFLFSVLALAPLSNWLGLKNGPICNYYLLLPLGGLAIACGAFLDLLLRRFRPIVAGAVFSGFVLMLGLETASRIPYWRDNFSLATMTLNNYPDNYLAQIQVAGYLRAMGREDEAYDAYQRAAEANPTLSFPWIGMSRIHLDQDRPEAALRVLDASPASSENMQALRAVALKRLGRDEEALLTLAQTNEERVDQAILAIVEEAFGAP